MIKSYIVYSKRRIYSTKENFEKVNVVSENSVTKEYLLNFRAALRSILAEKFKNARFQILIVGDENIRLNEFSLIKMIILFEEKEQVDFVKDSLTRIEQRKSWLDKIEFGVVDDIETTTCISCSEEIIQEWADEFQKYFANNFGFTGRINIETTFYEQELQSFWISASGKGLNDYIVNILKNISETFTMSKNFGIYIDDKYSFIDNYFQS
jgi:hypothetical protein